jgi:hypothetical protein
LSAIQTFSFILVGNSLLEIRGMTFSYWLILFSTSCLANMIGLNISSSFNSVITIYIFIPVIIIPQLLFSGVFVKFDKLHQGRFTSNEFVPVIGDMMPARWSFEALAVEQFKNNKYERNFFRYDMEISKCEWYSTILINDLKTDLRECSLLRDSLPYRQKVNDNFYKLNYYIEKLNTLAGFGAIKGTWKSSLNTENFNPETAKYAGKYLDSLGGQFRSDRKLNVARRDSVAKSLKESIGSDGLINLKNNYYNKQLENLVLDRMRVEQFIETNKRIIQKYEPGYMSPLSKYGRAQYYTPYKLIGDIKIDTYWFNLIVLWLVALALYAALYFNLFQKFVSLFENISIKNSEKL